MADVPRREGYPGLLGLTAWFQKARQPSLPPRVIGQPCDGFKDGDGCCVWSQPEDLMRMVGLLIYCLLHEKGYCRQHTPNKDHVRFVAAGRRVGFGAMCLRGMGQESRTWFRSCMWSATGVWSWQNRKCADFRAALGETPSLGEPHVGLACVEIANEEKRRQTPSLTRQDADILLPIDASAAGASSAGKSTARLTLFGRVAVRVGRSSWFFPAAEKTRSAGDTV
jgi:hypothetical protein